MIESRQIAFEDVFAVPCLRQQVRRPSPHHLHPVIDEVLQRLHQPHFFGLLVDHRQQDHAEAFLHLRVLEKLVQNDLRFGAALEFDDDAHAVAIALIANVRNIVNRLFVDQVGDALDQARLVHLVRNFRDDDGLLFLGDVFNRRPRTHHEAPTAIAVSFENSSPAVNDSCGWGSRALGRISATQQAVRLDC